MNQPPYNNQQPPYYTNGYPPNPGQFYYPPVPPPQPSRKYSIKILLILCVAYVLGLLFAFIGVAVGQGQYNFVYNLGISLLFGILVCLLILDSQGTVSLQGLIPWKKWKIGKCILIGFLCFIAFPFLLAIYFVRTYRLYKHIPYTAVRGSAPIRSRRPAVGLTVGGVVALFVLIFASPGGTSSAQQTTSTSSAGTSPSPTATTFAQVIQATPTKAVVKATPTAIPTHVPTATPTPIPHPTQVPTQPKPTPVPPQQLSLVFTGAYAADYSGGSVSVHTLPGAALTITVTYCSGHEAVSSSLKGTSYADGAGNHTWTWTPETKCRGTATADVIASENSQSTEQIDNFNVQ